MKNLLVALFTLALDYFTRHPQNEECHISSDGRVFHTLGAAESFVGALKDKTIKSYKRDEVVGKSVDDIEVEAEDVDGAPVIPIAPAAKDSGADVTTTNTKTVDPEVVTHLATFDFEAKDAYVAGKKLLGQLEIELESYTKDAVFAAIKTAQEAAASSNTGE